MTHPVCRTSLAREAQADDIVNAMLASAGCVWTIVPLERRDDYMAALNAASSGRDIVPFARLMGELVRAQTRKPLSRPAPAATRWCAASPT